MYVPAQAGNRASSGQRAPVAIGGSDDANVVFEADNQRIHPRRPRKIGLIAAGPGRISVAECTLCGMGDTAAGNRGRRLISQVWRRGPAAYALIWLLAAILAMPVVLSRFHGPAWFPHPHHRPEWGSFLPVIFLCVIATRGVHERRQLAALAERLRDAPPEIPRDVAHLRARGKRIQAIKRYRELNPGIDFREARYIINHIDLLGR
jgi:hypothetical protein